MFIFCCFSCENFLIGKRCLRQHAKECCRLEPSHRLFNTATPSTNRARCHEWINCFKCADHSTALLSDVVFVIAPLKWARLFVLLFKKHHTLVKLMLCQKAGLLTNDLERKLASFF